jgi:hypothetical protein
MNPIEKTSPSTWKGLIWSFALLASLATFGAWLLYVDAYVEWKEEVRLNDGRKIVVEQKKLADRGMAREAWFTLNLPEFSSQPIVWHGYLKPMVLNVDGGRLYLVGIYNTTVADLKKRYTPEPHPYVGFVWEGAKWVQIPFERIPNSIYNANLLIEDFPPRGTRLLTLEEKNSPNAYTLHQKQLDPDFRPVD